MEIENIIENLDIPKSKIKSKEPMKNHTTFKIGGEAQIYIKIDNIEDLKKVLKIAKKEQIPITIIGNGSNILVLDKGIKGITLEIKIEKIEIKKIKNNIQITVGAGEKLGKLAQMCQKEQITGLEELEGIPGTIGGAIKMNAGAHGKEIKDIIKTVKCIDYNGNETELTKEQLKFGYRTSIFKQKKYIITEATLELHEGKKEEIKEKMEQYIRYRKEKQPIEYPSAGSTFKRGEDFITSKLIEEAGLKGLNIGDAQVSTKHSGFIVNRGNATAQDVLELIEKVKNTVYEKFKKEIEIEIEIMGEE